MEFRECKSELLSHEFEAEKRVAEVAKLLGYSFCEETSEHEFDYEDVVCDLRDKGELRPFEHVRVCLKLVGCFDEFQTDLDVIKRVTGRQPKFHITTYGGNKLVSGSLRDWYEHCLDCEMSMSGWGAPEGIIDVLCGVAPNLFQNFTDLIPGYMARLIDPQDMGSFERYVHDARTARITTSMFVANAVLQHRDVPVIQGNSVGETLAVAMVKTQFVNQTMFERAMLTLEETYKKMWDAGTAQIYMQNFMPLASSVEMIVTATFAQWDDIFKEDLVEGSMAQLVEVINPIKWAIDGEKIFAD